MKTKGFEQVAFRVLDMDAAIKQLDPLGQTEWVRDRVDAAHLYLAHQYLEMGQAFQVHLAFNYQIIDGVELELIELRVGNSVQLPVLDDGIEQQISLRTGRDVRALSHLGYHVEDTTMEAEHEPLQEELKFWIRQGFPVRQLSQTMLHSGTTRRYRYAFVDARALLGQWVKIIQRLPLARVSLEQQLAQGRAAYAWLRDQEAL